MNFIAIDFETANEKRNSPCSIGIVVVENGKVKEKIHRLIKPKEMRFEPMNIWIHGIRPSMVEEEQEFDEVFKDIKHYFDGNLIIAHNAAFDISVLRNTLSLYDIEEPEFDYICTMKLSKNFYKGLENAKLNTVNELLGFKFKHHDALDDSLACSNILLNISKELETNNIKEVSKNVGVTLGKVYKGGYKPSSSKGSILKTSNRIFETKRDDSFDIKKESLKGEVVVFTGGLKRASRDEAMRLVRKAFGSTGSSVTKKTTMLVTGIKDIKSLKRSEMSNKLRRAVDLIDLGGDIKILSEEEFFKIIRN
ncbi:exonuclease domain-containing protein [Clostridium chrysemydis]|uniref:exonuclease domain-containing protein n=1 Tax=Clostridium chrysemydis TaxID=2665504 RepID=UPI003F3947C1